MVIPGREWCPEGTSGGDSEVLVYFLILVLVMWLLMFCDNPSSCTLICALSAVL